MINNTTQKIIQEFPRETRRYIKKNLVPIEDIQAAGINLCARDEIFVRLPHRWSDYAVSSYGRVLSFKGDTIREITPSDANGYLYVTLYSLPDLSMDKQCGEKKTFTIQQLIGWVFLPCYWSGLKDRQRQVHHIDHNPHNNHWKNLVTLPVWLHHEADKVQQVWFRSCEKEQFHKKSYYEAAELTGQSLENLIKKIKQKEDYVAEQNGKFLRCFDFEGCTVGFEMTEAFNNWNCG